MIVIYAFWELDVNLGCGVSETHFNENILDFILVSDDGDFIDEKGVETRMSLS
jgi:hypothetical protein